MSQESTGKQVLVQGRIVFTIGGLFQGKQKIDMNTKQPKINSQGQPIIEYGFGLAVPKSALGQNGPGQPGEIWAAMHQEAMSLYPQGLPPGFAMKYKDGDGVDHTGQPFGSREGYAGHIVLSLTTIIPIKFYRWNEQKKTNDLVSDGIKCGDYVSVAVGVKAHTAVGTHKPGLYLNPNAVQLLRYGQEIINAPTGDSFFGNAAPPGVDYTTMPGGGPAFPVSAPMAPAPAAVPGFQQQPAGYAAPMQPAPVQAAPAPFHGVLPQQFQPPQAPAAPAMPQPNYGPAQQPAYAPQQAVAPYPMQPTAPAGVPPMPPGFPVPGQR